MLTYTDQSLPPEQARGYVRRIEFCFTPKHGSWLNIAENELSCLTRQCLHGRRIGELATLQAEIAAWSIDITAAQRGVDWQRKIDDTRCKLKTVCPKFCLDRALKATWRFNSPLADARAS